MREIEKVGKTAEEAIEAALKELGVERDDVEVEVLNESSKGLLGIFGQTEARVKVTCKTSLGQKAVELTQQILSYLGIESDVILKTEDAENVAIEIDAGDDSGLIIGRRGETLAALQHIVSLLTNKDRTIRKRILLNAGGYLEKREQTLHALAERTAQKVKMSGREVTLEALSPRERRIIHMALANKPGISTSSIGVEPNRRVVISPTRDDRRSHSHSHSNQPEYRSE